MKNSINLNYGINVDKMYLKNDYNFFFYNNTKVYIYEVDENNNINEIINLSNKMFKKNIKVNTFILNKNNDYFSHFNSKTYILLKENSLEDISLKSIKTISKNDNKLSNFDIIKEWEKEVNVIEKELLETNDEFLSLKKDIDYYIGIAENAIQMLIKYHKKIINNSIGHRLDYKLFHDNNINNPLLFIRVNEMYDIANYIKYLFFNNKIDYDIIKSIINENNFENNIYLFVNLLYPSVYFDLVKKVLLNKEKEEMIIKYGKFRKKYLSFIKEIQYFMKRKGVKDVELINWLYMN